MRKMWTNYIGGAGAIGLFVLRIVFGVGMMMHGWSKIQTPFAWMKGGEVPGGLQALAALGEFGGGLALTFGFLTPLGCLGVLFTMTGAWWLSHREDSWIAPGEKTFELASLYAAVAFALLFTGPGRFSLDALFFGGKKR